MSVNRSEFSCRRGELVIRGLLYTPAEPAAHLPAIIISHGFTSNYKTTMHYAEEFAQWGYAAFCYDFCGGGTASHSDGKTTDMSVLTEREDLRAVIDYVTGLSLVNPNRLLLMGCSQGGFVSALTAVQVPERVAGMILFYPALCIPDDARAGQMTFAKFDPEDIPDVIECGPMKLGRVYPESVLSMDPFEEIRRYPGPVLIIHGTADALVNVSYAQRAYDAYTEGHPEQHQEKRLLLIEDGTHGFSKKHDRVAMEGVRRFLKDMDLMA